MAITQTITTIPTAGHRGVDTRNDFVTKQEAFQDALVDTFVTEINAFKTQANALETNVNAKEASAVIARDEAVQARNEAVGAAATLPDGIINDGTVSATDTWSSQKIDAEKQDTLVSSVNIKTIGGASILGSGDIPIDLTIPSFLPFIQNSFNANEVFCPYRVSYNSNIQYQAVGATNTIEYIPFVLYEDFTVSSLAIFVQTAQVVNAYLGIYNSSSGVPNTKIAGTSAINIGSIGAKIASVTPVLLNAGELYYMAIVVGGNTAKFYSCTATNLLGIDSSTGDSSCFSYLYQASSTLPATASPSGIRTIDYTNSCILIALKG